MQHDVVNPININKSSVFGIARTLGIKRPVIPGQSTLQGDQCLHVQCLLNLVEIRSVQVCARRDPRFDRPGGLCCFDQILSNLSNLSNQWHVCMLRNCYIACSGHCGLNVGFFHVFPLPFRDPFQVERRLKNSRSHSIPGLAKHSVALAASFSHK